MNAILASRQTSKNKDFFHSIWFIFKVIHNPRAAYKPHLRSYKYYIFPITPNHLYYFVGWHASTTRKSNKKRSIQKCDGGRITAHGPRTAPRLGDTLAGKEFSEAASHASISYSGLVASDDTHRKSRYSHVPPTRGIFGGLNYPTDVLTFTSWRKNYFKLSRRAMHCLYSHSEKTLHESRVSVHHSVLPLDGNFVGIFFLASRSRTWKDRSGYHFSSGFDRFIHRFQVGKGSNSKVLTREWWL